MPGLSETVQEVTDFVKEKIEENEDFIIIESEPEGGINGVMQKVMGDITTASAGRQAAVGGVTGCVAGYLTNRVGRAIGLSLAGTFILFQIAQHKGYVKVNWTQVKRALTKAKADARINELKLRQASFTGKVRNFIEDNFFLSTGFMGGFAVGFFF
ncbi:FUN14 domain-containing protein 1 [Elysia marginata]|uniref:FUN14 domain-containing protein 1 n=1 Tax=Elysia marginata TaxID=1093978 RepID=A0AAV4INT8_9GAST|nr:FUN14 domain-containing protein 1 [Elysia marginata]